MLQGGAGALVAMVVLWLVFAASERAIRNDRRAQAVGLGAITFLPWSLGCAGAWRDGYSVALGGLIVARGVR